MRNDWVLLSLCLFVACEGGLEPPRHAPGIAGVLTFENPTWPPADSLSGLWLFASTEYPLDSARVVQGVLFEPRFIFLYPSINESLPKFVESTSFDFALVQGTYRYIGVIQQYRPELLVSSFRVVGVLTDPLSPGIPRSVTIGEDTFIDGLSMHVDFHNPPPQPFE